MSLPEFAFSLLIGGPGFSDAVVADVAAAVARQAGCAPDAADELADAVRRAFVDQRSGGAACRVQFRAHAGELQVTISGEHREWRASRPLP